MFNFVGKQAMDGATSRLTEKLKKFDFYKTAEEIPVLGQMLPMWKDIKAGYNSMSDEERSEFWKNVMITGAKIGTKI